MCTRLAGIIGGGGHMRASGCVLTGDLQQVTNRVLQAAVEDVPGEGHL
jgi:nanoRNase/pAp phosphatase (c-di-AMP/oligoRNAs hydrolase)